MAKYYVNGLNLPNEENYRANKVEFSYRDSFLQRELFDKVCPPIEINGNKSTI